MQNVWWVLLLVWGLSWALTSVQIRHYRRFISTMRQREGGPGTYFATGVARRWVGRGCVAALLSNAHGVVIKGYTMEGRTIWARFRERPELSGLLISELLVEHPRTSRQKALKDAGELIARQLPGYESQISLKGLSVQPKM
ncbi:MAG: hypothetical protein M0Z53_12990 [Thermaerobacter sp.]|nr:hypothetical protein [Thermaerobacter sp.]